MGPSGRGERWPGGRPCDGRGAGRPLPQPRISCEVTDGSCAARPLRRPLDRLLQDAASTGSATTSARWTSGIHLADRWRSLNIGAGLFAGSILPGSNRLVVTGFSPAWRGFYVSSLGGAGLVFDNLGHQHGQPRRQGADAVDPLPEPQPRRGDRRRGHPGRPRAGLGAGPRRRLRPDGGGPRALRGPLRDRPARPRRRPRGGVDRLRRHRQRARREGPAHPRRHLGRPRRDGLEDAPGPRHRRGDLRRDLRRRGLPRPQGGRRVVRGALQAAPRDEGLRGDDEVPLRPEVRDRRHLRRELRHAEGAPHGVQLPLHPLHRRRSGSSSARAADRSPLPRAVQRGDDREAGSSRPAASRARPSARSCATSTRRTSSPTRRWARSAASSTSAPPSS